MLSRFIPLLLLAIASVSPVSAESRPWKSADGTKSIQGDFISRDASSVKIRLADGKEIAIDLGKLHADDAKWLNLNHPDSGDPAPDEAAVFDTLKFGDKHDAVLAKLKASKFVELTMAESMISRTGLNGIFRIRQKIGGQTATLYFDWTETDALKEITVRTDGFPAASFDAKLAPCWKEFIELLTTLHGRPLQAVPKINPASVPNGATLSSHLWRLESGGSATLGVGCEGTSYQVVVRFTEEKIEPVTSNAPAKPVGPDIDFAP
ncbi:MAG: hypothetical protein ABIT37_18665 [Luteolibacter sp.]